MKKSIIPKKQPTLEKPASLKKTGFPKKADILPPVSRKANRYFVLFFFLFALVLYGNTILNKFAVDDNYVTNNSQVQRGF